MRATRPTRSAASPLMATATFALAFTLLFALASPAPAEAYEFAGSPLENAIAKTVDIAIVRPLASLRVLVGGVLFVPAALLSSPGGKESFESAYDLLVGEPVEFAFERELGEF